MPQMQNRVQETTTTGGTGTLTLAGAVTGYITFASGFSTGTSLFYTIDNGVGEWEIGIGTLVTTGTLSRVTVIASSNGGALVNFGSGTKRVFCSAPTRSLVPDQDSKSGYVLTTDGTDPAWTQTINGITIGNLTAAGGAFTTLSASSTVSGSGFSTYLASPPAIGGTTPAAGAFTTLSASSTVSGTGFSTYLASPPAIGGTVAAAGAFTTLSASSTVSGSGFSTYLASPPAIGGTTPAAGKFTILEATGNTTLGDASGDTVAIRAGTAAFPTLIPNGDPDTGIYFPAANQLAISSQGVRRFNISNSQVDTYLPTYTTNTDDYAVFTARTRADNAAYSSRITANRQSSAGLATPNNASIGGLYFDGLTSTNGYVAFGSIECGIGTNTSTGAAATLTTYLSNGSTSYARSTLDSSSFTLRQAGSGNISVSFNTTVQNALTLDASGNLLVGRLSTGSGILGNTFGLCPGGAGYNESVNSTSDTGLALWYINRETSTGTLFEFRKTSTKVGAITTNGTGVTYGSESDYRLKDNVQPITNALSRVALLKPSKYTWKADQSEGEGFIAHELQEVVPQAVTGEKDGEKMQDVDYGKITPLLAAAIQELHQEIEQLKQRIN